MTATLDWLVANFGLQGLSKDELDALRDFTLAWALFEGRAMGTQGSQPRLAAAVDAMALPGAMPAYFDEALAFWRNRYWENGAETDAFRALNFANNQYRTLAVNVLSGASADAVETVKALLLIAMRLRNNLFHGVKWQYRMEGQLDNFCHANAVLMQAIDMVSPAQP